MREKHLQEDTLCLTGLRSLYLEIQWMLPSQGWSAGQHRWSTFWQGWISDLLSSQVLQKLLFLHLRNWWSPRHFRAKRLAKIPTLWLVCWNFFERMNTRSGSLKSLRWLGTVLGWTECANFFVKIYCLWYKHLENETILGGHRARFFRKWVLTLLFSTFLSMESMGKRWLACL